MVSATCVRQASSGHFYVNLDARRSCSRCPVPHRLKDDGQQHLSWRTPSVWMILLHSLCRFDGSRDDQLNAFFSSSNNSTTLLVDLNVSPKCHHSSLLIRFTIAANAECRTASGSGEIFNRWNRSHFWTKFRQNSNSNFETLCRETSRVESRDPAANSSKLHQKQLASWSP